MKRFLLSLLALLALVACNSKNDDTPTIDKSQQQQINLPTKKVKHVTYTYVEEQYTQTNTTFSYSDYLKPTLRNQVFLQHTVEFAYEYDTAGRINKITIKKENTPDEVKTFEYTANTLIIGGLLNNNTQKVEYGLNAAGNVLGFGTYNEKQQVSTFEGEKITWEDDNSTKTTQKIRNESGEVIDYVTTFTYYNYENKNKINFCFISLGIDGNSLENYFSTSIAMIMGVPAKNLLKEVSSPFYRRYNPYPIKIAYTYDFDADGFITTVAEKSSVPSRRNESDGGLYGGNSFYSTEAKNYWDEVQALVTNIQNGTVTDKEYKLITDTEQEKTFQIIIPIKVEKDKNGKNINLEVTKICEYTISYKTENNQKKIDRISNNLKYINNKVSEYRLDY